MNVGILISFVLFVFMTSILISHKARLTTDWISNFEETVFIPKAYSILNVVTSAGSPLFFKNIAYVTYRKQILVITRLDTGEI